MLQDIWKGHKRERNTDKIAFLGDEDVTMATASESHMMRRSERVREKDSCKSGKKEVE